MNNALLVQGLDLSPTASALNQAITRAPEQKLRNRLLETQANQMDESAMLTDVATDALMMKPALESGNIQEAIAMASSRIEKIKQRGGDPSHTMRFLDALSTGKITPQQASMELDSVINAARQRGLLGQDGMTDYQKQSLELQRMRLAADGGDPSAVREYKYFSSLDEDAKREFLTTKRAGTYFDKGDVTMKADPLNGTAAPVQEAGKSQTQEQIQSELTAQSAVKAASEKAATTAISKSEEAFNRIEPIRQSIANYDEAIRLIDEGANTGVIQSKLPSFKQASQELDNLQGRLGLDVIGNTTFGALSEAELKFALSTALPKNLEGPALKQWIQRKKIAQQKLLSYTQQAATYLGTPGNTISGWIQTQRQGALDKIPAQAIDYLKSNPDLKDQFMDKYGVLPDGF